MRRVVCEPTTCVNNSCVSAGWLPAYLNLQGLITANALVVHLVVGIVGITAAFVLHEGKASFKLDF